MREIIARGAEAVLYRDVYDGRPALVKERVKKSYRIPQLDIRLRIERTRTEARLLNEAGRAGVAVPAVLRVDEKNAKITMEYVDGKRLKELLNSTDEKSRKELAGLIGISVAKLHSHNIIHGDLTTSNMIRHDDKLFFIDFGLGFFSGRAEDMGTDLAVLHEAVRSTHFEHLNTLWGIIVKSYSASFAGAEKALKALEDIEKRGRYVRRKEV
ncbi:MAG: KEOPS complex kinase/ATPase Bud32 [Candidatus Aenigmatarchaeota archaeon]